MVDDMGQVERLFFGRVTFLQREEYLEFQFKFLSVVLFSGALLTALLLISSDLEVNAIDPRHVRSMRIFTGLAIVLWLLLRGHKERFVPIAWVYEILCMGEYISATLFVPSDELRIFWFVINVPGVFILLGKTAGWVITLFSIILVVINNRFSTEPYSTNAMATYGLGMLYFGLFFHVYAARSISYFHRMRESNEKLAHMASHDTLTGVFNARAYYDACNRLISGAERSGETFSVLFVDLDHFKSINDTYGHAAGDQVLRTVAQALAESIRQSDVLGRIGGEEFSIFLPATDSTAALEVAEKLRQSVASLAIPLNDRSLRITASVGVAGRGSERLSMIEIQQRADQAMYAAKAGGRNRVSRFPVPDAC